MGCISSKHSSKQGRHSRASILPIVNSFLKVEQKQLLLDDQPKELLLQDGWRINKTELLLQDDQRELQVEGGSHVDVKSLHQMLEEEPEVINVWELMEGLEDDSSSREVSSKLVESSESRNNPGSGSLNLISAAASVDASACLVAEDETSTSTSASPTADTDGSPTSPLCLDSTAKRRLKRRFGAKKSALDALVTNRNFSFKLMYLGDQVSTPKLILDSNSPLVQKEQFRNRLNMSEESNMSVPAGCKDSPAHGDQLHDEELLCTFENMLEQLSSDEWLSRRPNNASQPFDRESTVSSSTVNQQSSITLYFTRDDGGQNVYKTAKSILLNYDGITVNEKDMSSSDSSIPLPALFINDRYIGGAEQLLQLHKDGQLGLLLSQTNTFTKQDQCQGCGGLRSVPCLDCNGSLRFLTEDGKLQACMECDEKGLVKCPLCS